MCHGGTCAQPPPSDCMCVFGCVCVGVCTCYILNVKFCTLVVKWGHFGWSLSPQRTVWGLKLGLNVAISMCVCVHKVLTFLLPTVRSQESSNITQSPNFTFLPMLAQRCSLWLHWNLRAVHRDTSCVLKCQSKVFTASFLPPGLNLDWILRVCECITMVAASNMHAPVHWERRALLPHLL